MKFLKYTQIDYTNKHMNKFKFLLLSLLLLLFFIVGTHSFPLQQYPNNVKVNVVKKYSPPCVDLYFNIKKYADSFNIPKKYAFGVARMETGYRGPKHFKYNPSQTSTSNAVGPMQIKLNTARWVNKDSVMLKVLKNNIEYNVMTSLKYLRNLKDRFKTWEKALGYYNTGYPKPNEYAYKIINYKLDWI